MTQPTKGNGKESVVCTVAQEFYRSRHINRRRRVTQDIYGSGINIFVELCKISMSVGIEIVVELLKNYMAVAKKS
jgi:hypothetical protein